MSATDRKRTRNSSTGSLYPSPGAARSGTLTAAGEVLFRPSKRRDSRDRFSSLRRSRLPSRALSV